MNIDSFRRIVTTFADAQTPLLFEKDRAMIQVYGDLIEVTLKQRAGEVSVIDGEVEVPAVRWILNRLARLPLLADRLLSAVPTTDPFVIPEGEVLPSLAAGPSDEQEYASDALKATINALDSGSPLETSVLYLTSDAGEGKTCLINEMSRFQAQRFKNHESDWLLVPIPLGGRTFNRFDDITVGVLQNRYRFPYLYYDSFLELVRLGVLIPAFDGFEEMFVERVTGDTMTARTAMGILISSLESSGALLIAARKAYFEFQDLKDQARLFDELRTAAVTFGKITLHRWQREQFVAYCIARNVDDPDALYQNAIERLAPNHPLVTRPVLVRRLVDVAVETATVDEFLAKLEASGPDFFFAFIQAIVEREANEKWTYRAKGRDFEEPLLSVDEHYELLAAIALEMWQSRVDFLSATTIQQFTDLFSEAKRKPAEVAEQIRELIKGHALLIASPNAKNALEFDHDEFKQFFLAQALTELCMGSNGSSRADLLNAFRKGTLPEHTFQMIVRAIRQTNRSEQRRIASLLADTALLESQTSFTHENCTSLALALISGEDGMAIKLRGMFFPANSLREKNLNQIVFDDCFIAHTSLDNTSLNDCTFKGCQFARIDVYDSTRIHHTTLTDCKVECVWMAEHDAAFYDPTLIPEQLVRAGFLLPEIETQTNGEPQPKPLKEEGIVLFERVLRYFTRSTQISEGVIRMKLGVRTNTFFSNYIPALITAGVFVAVESKSDPQMRFRLGVPMAVISSALDSCGGSFLRFLELVTERETSVDR